MEDLKTIGDNRIVELFFLRDEDAIKATSLKYGALFRSVAQGILGDIHEAEECENDTYLRLWNAIPPARPVNLGAYGAKTARNLALDALDKRGAEKRGGDIVFIELDDSLPDPSGRIADEQELGSLIDKFLRGIKRAERIMFVKRYFYCEQPGKIAAECGCSESKVKSQLFRTRKKLKAFLEKEGVSL